jgi:hypothetical protein
MCVCMCVIPPIPPHRPHRPPAQPSTIGAALDALLAWEKKTRLAADSWSTAHIAQAIVKLCGDLKQWRSLNDQVSIFDSNSSMLRLDLVVHLGIHSFQLHT